MNQVSMAKPKKKKLHPQKFAMWIGIGSIIMMFAGFTSGYVVRRSQGNWQVFDLPAIFYYSTVAIALSSLCYFLAVKAFKQAQFSKFRGLLTLTLVLGIAFSVMQLLGFQDMTAHDIRVDGNPSGSFIYVIAIAHLLHIIGGIVVLGYQLFKTRRNEITEDKMTGLEIVGNYWHFVDFLWLYLFVFFLLFR